MLLIIQFCCLLWGLSCLACCMQQHQRQLFKQLLANTLQRSLKVMGWGLIFAGAGLAIWDKGVALGLSLYLGSLSFAALLLLLLLSYYPKKLGWINLLALLLCAVLIGLHVG